ncbi:TetR/AcrR family transcriptional regulator [Streptomyces sp. TLI_171]|uniref:TetR/AcrR family transcriptional regulator n=1 Tax=Streptomyces sp. TLI_171 TaxID=1938859 RepID=UPI000C18652F|nr:TetR family transcriptional regulator [Streptomyces sp. TLI_171]RKE18446.1 TetR family transcriptional regulator [Streptomyces sp. TLI_171]
MTFQRARTDEQRSQRRRQILDAAATMLTEMPAAQLSLTALSRRVCLAKANVLRYFDSREAVLLELLERQFADWAAELAREPVPVAGGFRQRADRLAELLADSMARRPVLCDLLAEQAAVLEHNISAETAIRHKRAARASLHDLVELTARHLPELGEDDAAALVETVLLTAVAAWPFSRPPQAVLAAFAADPELSALRVDFTAAVRRAGELTAAGLLARRAADGS